MGPLVYYKLLATNVTLHTSVLFKPNSQTFLLRLNVVNISYTFTRTFTELVMYLYVVLTDKQIYTNYLMTLKKEKRNVSDKPGQYMK